MGKIILNKHYVKDENLDNFISQLDDGFMNEIHMLDIVNLNHRYMLFLIKYQEKHKNIKVFTNKQEIIDLFKVFNADRLFKVTLIK